MEKENPTPKNGRFFDDTIGKHEKMALRALNMNDGPVTLETIAKVMGSDDDYFRQKRDEDEVRAMLLVDYVYNGVNRFDQDWLYKYVKFLKHDDRVLLIKCFLDGLNKFVEKYREIYPVRLLEDRFDDMMEIVNVLLISVQAFGITKKACSDVKDSIAGKMIENSLLLKLVSGIFRYDQRVGMISYNLIKI